MRSADKNDKLSQRQEDILAYVNDFLQEHGISPAIRDIQTSLGISSTSVVAYNLKVLEEKGKITRKGRISRGIQLTKPISTTTTPPDIGALLRVPLLGTITAGGPLPDPQEINAAECDTVEVPPEVVPASRISDVYALKVRGTSMIDALIDDGDIVLLRQQPTAENGQTVAVRLVDENAVTLKRFYHEGERIRLQPANQTMDPIFTHPDNVIVHGRVVGVLRSFQN
jgi:repressor LexA